MISSVKGDRFLARTSQGSAVTYHGQVQQSPVPIAMWLLRCQSSGLEILGCFGNYSLFLWRNILALASGTVCVLPLASFFAVKINSAASSSNGLAFACIFRFFQASGMTNFNLLVVLVCPLVFIFCGSLDRINLFVFLFVSFFPSKLVAYIPPFIMSKGLFSVFFLSKFQEDERPVASYLQQEMAYSHVVLAAAQRNLKSSCKQAPSEAGRAGSHTAVPWPSTPTLFPCITFPATLPTNTAPQGSQFVLSAASYGRAVAAGVLWAARSLTVLWMKPQMLLHQISPRCQVPSWNRPLRGQL